MSITPTTPTTSYAPAGRKYNSIQHAGQCMLRQYCDDFPNTSSSFILPPMFKAEYPEAHGKTTLQVERSLRNLTVKEENKFYGIRSGQKGEQGEYLVYCMLQDLIGKQHTEPFLVLRNFKLDVNKNIKRRALMAEFGIELEEVKTRGEFDLVVIVKDLGIVLVEVKATALPQNLMKAEDQLDHAETFMSKLLNAVTWSRTSVLPCARMIIISNELSASPTSKTAFGSHLVYEDLRNNFEGKWSDVINELRAINTICSSDMQILTHILMGIWSMEALHHGYDFRGNEAFLPSYQLKEIDTMVDTGIVSSDEAKQKNEQKKELPVTNIVRAKANEIFRNTHEIKLMYLTPSQKEVYDLFPRVMIRGHAGTGKSLLTLFKIIDLIQNHNKQKVLLLAPHPHHLRCRSILMSNNISVTIMKKFLPNSSSDVEVMELGDFFRVPKEELLSYDLSEYHLFIDDLQQYVTPKKKEFSTCADYDDIGEFLDNTYSWARKNDLYMWCAMDLLQSLGLHKESGRYPKNLFHPHGESTLQNLSIPTYELTDILRNSSEIAKVISQVRKNRIAETNSSLYVVANTYIGHNITSELIHYHKLQQGAEDVHRKSFAVERLSEEVSLMLRENSYLKASDIAILFEGLYFSKDFQEAIENEVNDRMHIGTQTIEESLINGNDDDIVSDHVDSVMSFESACIIYLRTHSYDGWREIYNLTSRARTRLIIIDVEVKQPPFITHEINLTTWKEVQGQFHRIDDRTPNDF